MISISSNLFNPTEKLKIQLSVGLNNDEYKNLVNVYENAKGIYISFNPNIVIKMTFNSPNKKWEKTDVIYINERNIYMLVAGLHEFYEKLMTSDRFIYNDKGYVVEINSKDSCQNVSLTKGQMIQLEPAILYDKQGYSLPGVMLRVNMKSNEVDLSIDEFESMMYMFDHIRIHQEGMLVLQTYLLMRKKELMSQITQDQNQKQTTNKPFNYKKSIFDRSEQGEFVKTPTEKKQPDVFMNLPEDINE